ncbi:hypothetical protein [Azospirillum sp. ST 5-10]|uniref:hypothetical protein n=1 Tax=unclassified Azospirillum TaxID=2630922 RepID=UPI003F49CF8F
MRTFTLFAVLLAGLTAGGAPRAAEFQTYTPGGRIGDQPPPAAAPEAPPPPAKAPGGEAPPVRRGSSTPPPPPRIAGPTVTPSPMPPDIRGATDSFKRDLDQPALDRLRLDRALGRLDPAQERDLMMRQHQLDSLTRDPLRR